MEYSLENLPDLMMGYIRKCSAIGNKFSTIKRKKDILVHFLEYIQRTTGVRMAWTIEPAIHVTVVEYRQEGNEIKERVKRDEIILISEETYDKLCAFGKKEE